jgi:hypothetical protein
LRASARAPPDVARYGTTVTDTGPTIPVAAVAMQFVNPVQVLATGANVCEASLKMPLMTRLAWPVMEGTVAWNDRPSDAVVPGAKV